MTMGAKAKCGKQINNIMQIPHTEEISLENTKKRSSPFNL